MRPTADGDLTEAAAFLADLGARGFRLKPLPDGHIVVYPGSRLDEETIARIRQMKAPLLEALCHSTWPCIRCHRFRFPRPCVCYWCRRAEGFSAHA